MRGCEDSKQRKHPLPYLSLASNRLGETERFALVLLQTSSAVLVVPPALTSTLMLRKWNTCKSFNVATASTLYLRFSCYWSITIAHYPSIRIEFPILIPTFGGDAEKLQCQICHDSVVHKVLLREPSVYIRTFSNTPFFPQPHTRSYRCLYPSF